jgi:hypothetical protein
LYHNFSIRFLLRVTHFEFEQKPAGITRFPAICDFFPILIKQRERFYQEKNGPGFPKTEVLVFREFLPEVKILLISVGINIRILGALGLNGSEREEDIPGSRFCQSFQIFPSG